MAMNHPKCLNRIPLPKLFFFSQLIKLCVEWKTITHVGRGGGPIFPRISTFSTTIKFGLLWEPLLPWCSLSRAFFTLEIKRWGVQRSPICSHPNNKWSRWPKSLCTGAQWQALSGWQQISTEQNNSSVVTTQLKGKGHHLGMENFSETGWWYLYTAIDCGYHKTWYEIALRVLHSYYM